MARNNTISATFQMAAGDGASGFTESISGVSFTSGDAVKIEGTQAHGAAFVHLATSYGMAQFDGVYLENRDTSNEIVIILLDASDNALSTLKIAPNGVFMVRLDADQTAVAKVSLQGSTAPCEFVLCLSE